MASNFDIALPTILEHEGGFVDNIHDPGGATNYGISLRYLQARGDLDGDGFLDGDIDRDGDVDADDIVAMDADDAAIFYKTGFWYPGKYGLIDDQDLSTKAFDLGVNMGIKQGAKCIQRALLAVGVDLKDDGAIGPVTIEAINGEDPLIVLAATRSEAAGFYRALILRNSALRKRMIDVPDFSVFKTGWLRRAYS
jgi:lysozyme family protein